MTAWPMVEQNCVGCEDNPCRCPRPVTVTCQCGGQLSANDTLEEKGRAHVAHVRGERHQRWRDRQ